MFQIISHMTALWKPPYSLSDSEPIHRSCSYILFNILSQANHRTYLRPPLLYCLPISPNLYAIPHFSTYSLDNDDQVH